MTFQYICRTFTAFILIFSLMVSILANQISATPKDNQTIPFSKSIPSSNVTTRNTTTSTAPLSGFMPDSQAERNTDQFDMTMQLTPHTQNQYMRDDGWFEVLGWQLGLSNPSSLCPTQNCSFQLEGGLMGEAYSPGERTLSGKLRISSGDTTKIKDLSANWAAIEERIEAGQMVQGIEGSLTVGTDRTGPENRYQIDGTLAPYGQGYILTIHGVQE